MKAFLSHADRCVVDDWLTLRSSANCFSNLWLAEWEDIDSDEELECEDAAAPEEEAAEEEAGGSTPRGAIPVTDCLFCPHHSSSLTKNVAHMTKVHSFFIPDVEYLSDLKGLIKYLGKFSRFFLLNDKIPHYWGALVWGFSSILD